MLWILKNYVTLQREIIKRLRLPCQLSKESHG